MGNKQKPKLQNMHDSVGFVAQTWDIIIFLEDIEPSSLNPHDCIDLKKTKTAAGLYTAPQLFWENSDECEPGPPYYGAVQRTSLFPDWNLKRCFCVFSISPHNEGNNKHGYNNVLLQIRSGREG